MPHGSAMSHKKTQSYPSTCRLIHTLLCIFASSGAKAAGLELTWLYKGTGTVLVCYSRVRMGEEGGRERVSSHLVVLKTPGMLLL